MGTIEVENGLVKYITKGSTYYVKQNFAPSVQVFKAEVPARQQKGIPETFFSNGPVEKLVSLIGAGRANVVSVKLASDLDLTLSEHESLTDAVGPDYYFSRSTGDYSKDNLPHTDVEIASGYQSVLDILVRNWDDGERNMHMIDGIPVWFDFGVSLDPRCQNVYRFILKLEEARNMGRASTIVDYFMGYSRRRSQILKNALSAFKSIGAPEIRTLVKVSQVTIPGYFGEYLARNVSRLDEDIDIIRTAFLKENVEGRQAYTASYLFR